MPTISPDFQGDIARIKQKLDQTSFVESDELAKMSKTLRSLAHQTLPIDQENRVIDLIGRVDTQALDRKVEALVDRVRNGDSVPSSEVEALKSAYRFGNENLGFLRLIDQAPGETKKLDTEETYSLLYDIAHAFYNGNDFEGEMLFNQLPLDHRNALKARFPKTAPNQIVNYTLRPQAIMAYVGELTNEPDLGSAEELTKLFGA